MTFLDAVRAAAHVAGSLRMPEHGIYRAGEGRATASPCRI
jgi:hypothetical protein